MRITDLPRETFDEMCSVLGKETTINWRKLMTESFCSLYLPKHVEEIGQKRSPADALLNDLADREVPLEDLLRELQKLGNKKAVSIIIKAIKRKDFNGAPPTQTITREPEESTATSSHRGQTETLPPYSIEESSTHGGDPCYPKLEEFMEQISMLFPCMKH
ncbi:uncharacterized protein [Montipora foliosa]|uniref:uncharacterized protein n=1 Tax=Montipora foliosa TaxID=591990 RepID=UPI0035F1C0B1